jgi:hypothetical protein
VDIAKITSHSKYCSMYFICTVVCVFKIAKETIHKEKKEEKEVCGR